MRCLTLADAIAAKGGQCTFICREHTGNLNERIRSKGHTVQSLPMGETSDADLAHSAWLGTTQGRDAQACALILAGLKPDWLVVDHYALDSRWEFALSEYCAKVMVIDDLADRSHYCRVLLDQTLGRSADDYRSLVPTDCTLLCGSNYALLRPEFAALRTYSLQRRAQPKLKNLLITMGGVDKDNVTAKVLNVLRANPIPVHCKITVVMGPTSPWLSDVKEKARAMPLPTTVLVNVDNMAQLMADSDLAIGAAGGSSWERCCLGLPTIMLMVADNQRDVAQALEHSGSVKLLNLSQNTTTQLRDLLFSLIDDPVQLLNMINCAANIVDGSGVDIVVHQMEAYGVSI